MPRKWTPTWLPCNFCGRDFERHSNTRFCDDMCRLLGKVEIRACWQWIGSLHRKGYGEFYLNRKLLKAHRAAYEMFVGPIPTGLELDHLCRNRACVNPWHLEPVTHRENLLRGDTIIARAQKGVRAA